MYKTRVGMELVSFVETLVFSENSMSFCLQILFVVQRRCIAWILM